MKTVALPVIGNGKSSNDAKNGAVPFVSPSNHSNVDPSSFNDSSLDDALLGIF